MRLRPLLFLGILSLAGVLAYPYLEPEPWPVLGAGVLVGLLGLHPGWGRVVAVLALAFLLGLAAPAVVPQGPELEGWMRIRGVVGTGSGGRVTWVDLQTAGPVGSPSASQRGRIRVLFPGRAPPPGTPIVALGQIRPEELQVLPGEPDPLLAMSLSRSHSFMSVDRWQPIGETPKALSARFDGARNADILRALAWGDCTGIGPERNALFRRTGTSHLLSISGLHVGLVAGATAVLVGGLAHLLVLRLPRSGSRWWGGIAAAFAAVGYCSLAGWPVSATRSAVMVVLGILALALERRKDVAHFLGAAALLLVIWDPSAIIRPGWQLSFGALAGLLLVGPRISRLLPPDMNRLPRWLANSMIATLAATAGTLPASAWWFQTLPPLSPMANLVAIPLIGGLVTPAALLALILPPAIAGAVVRMADRILDLTLWWLEAADGPQWHPAVASWGAILLLCALLLRRRPMLAALLALVALGLRIQPAHRLVLTFLSVGDGDATLVEWPDGRRWLVDGGPAADNVAAWLRRRGVAHLDAVILTHPHPDHIGGLASVISGLPVSTLWVSRLPREDEPPFADLLDVAARNRVPVRLASEGDLPLLHPLPGRLAAHGDNVNDESIVLLLQHGVRQVLLAGDIEAHGEAEIARWLGPVDLLKVPHHGSRTSSTPDFLDVVRPEMAVITCSGRRPFPYPEVLARYRGTALYRTDLDGTIEASTNGWDFRVRTWKPGRGWQDLWRRPLQPG